MSQEGQLLDKKSLRAVSGKTANWSELAKDCIAFANSLGGTLLIGIEDGQDNPSAEQTIPPELPDTIRRKLAECTVNVTVFPSVNTAANGGQFVALNIPRAISVASGTDGRYFLRVADQSKPVTGDDVLRLASERAALPWETLTTLNVKESESDPKQLGALVHRPYTQRGDIFLNMHPDRQEVVNPGPLPLGSIAMRSIGQSVGYRATLGDMV